MESESLYISSVKTFTTMHESLINTSVKTMTTILPESVMKLYIQVKNNADPRTEHMPLVRDPLWPIFLIFGYLFIVVYGPKFMKNREAFGLRKLLVVYNLGLVILSAWMTYGYFAYTVQEQTYSVLCEPVIPENTSAPRLKLLRFAWWYFFSKVIEFADTFFFILRKKNNQISFLHVYHHCSVFILQWFVFRYVPDGVSCFGSFLNSFVHVVMYAYYGLAAIGPHMQKYLWWKRYLTRLQLIQFIGIFTQNSYAMWLNCGFPFFWHMVLKLYTITLFTLFANFYIRAYLSNRRKVTVEDESYKLKVN